MDTDSASKKVLIVEDDKLQQIILERMLSEMGHTVLGKVTRGAEAIKSAMRLDAVDLILMDIRLADDIDGIEAMRKIRKTSNVNVIYVTGNSEESNRRRAQEVGYIDFISKPVKRLDLEKAFMKAFSNS